MNNNRFMASANAQASRDHRDGAERTRPPPGPQHRLHAMVKGYPLLNTRPC